MTSTKQILFGLLAGVFVVGPVFAHDDHVHMPQAEIAQTENLEVTPEAERLIAADLQANGPSETNGIEAVTLLGSVSLDGEFADVSTRMLRARELAIAPGGIVAVHQHDGRPGVAYIISGQMTEHRAGETGPVVKEAGDTAFEQTGTIHWWENEGDTVARVIVVDIVPAE
ncbi:MAG: cupin domain-containing protein [Pseudomonadota bacterium]